MPSGIHCGAMPTSSESTPPEPGPLVFFEGFAWSVPTAFASALAGFRFEQGDVLYRDPAAYDAQRDAGAAGGTALQVLLPKRSGRATPADTEGDRRTALWQSEVVLERVDLEAGTSRPLTVSQGKLLMTLWTGEEGWLDPERDEPALPLSGRDLAGRLEETEGTLDADFETKRGARFLFVVDLASDASRAKAAAIEEALAAVGPVERVERSAARSGVSDAECFHPALRVRGLAVRGADEDRVQTALRGALYGGSATPDPDAEGASPDRFSVTRHGRLAMLGAD